MYLNIVFPPLLQQFWSVWSDCTHMYKSLVFGDEFLAQGLHLESHQKCSAGIRLNLSAIRINAHVCVYTVKLAYSLNSSNEWMTDSTQSKESSQRPEAASGFYIYSGSPSVCGQAWEWWSQALLMLSSITPLPPVQHSPCHNLSQSFIVLMGL